jgi:hypothetical protein
VIVAIRGHVLVRGTINGIVLTVHVVAHGVGAAAGVAHGIAIVVVVRIAVPDDMIVVVDHQDDVALGVLEIEE